MKGMRTSNCERCYRRKGKCDRQQPCGPCASAQVRCTYLERPNHARGVRRDSAARPRLERPAPRSSDGANQIASFQHRAGSPGEVSLPPNHPTGACGSYRSPMSEVPLADLVRSSLDVTTMRAASTGDGLDTSAVHASLPVRSTQDLPPQELAQHLLDTYIDHDAIIYPFLLPKSLSESQRRLYVQPTYYISHATPFEVFAAYMVFAISASHVQRNRSGLEPTPRAYYLCAMRELDAVMSHNSTERLQAVLLLCQYRSCSPIRDNSASMWHLVGVAACLCIEFGLHQEAGYPLTIFSETDEQELNAFREQEIRRRCFWTLISMDRIVSIVLGRPFAIRNDDIDALLPKEEHDGIINSQRSTPVLARTAISKKIIKYRLLCGEISTQLHGRKPRNMSQAEVGVLMQDLANKVKAWHASTPHLPRSVPSNELQSCYLSSEWYDLLASNAALMLWRPSPLLVGPAHSFLFIERIWQSASSAITIYTDLHRSRKINYNWITLQSVFLAGLAYIYAIGQHFRHRRVSDDTVAPLLSQEPSALEVVRTTKACSKVLVAIGERWDIPQNCHEVFDRLSDAILTDAINFSITTPQQQSADGFQERRHHELNIDHILDHPALLQASIPNASPDGLVLPNRIFHPHTSPLAVDNEFLSCFDDLQRLYDDQYLDNSIMDVSQDWLGYLDNAEMSLRVPI